MLALWELSGRASGKWIGPRRPPPLAQSILSRKTPRPAV